MTLRETFNALASQWLEETAYLSGSYEEEPTYPKLVAMGLPIVPFIVERLKDPNDPAIWMWVTVLRGIFGDGPRVPEKDQGQWRPVLLAWMSWLRDQGYT